MEISLEELADGFVSGGSEGSSNVRPISKRKTVLPSEDQINARKMTVDEVGRAIKVNRFLVREEDCGNRKGAAFWTTIRRVIHAHSGDKLDFVCCSLCMHVWKYDRTSSTDPLNRHTKTCGKKAGQQKITGFLEDSQKLPLSAKQQVSRACARYCAIDSRSFAEVQGKGFRALIDTVIDVALKYGHAGKPTAKNMLPDPTTISEYVGKEANSIRAVLMKEVLPILQSEGGGITLDFWEEEYTRVSYLGCTVHYMYEGSELRERLLLCVEWDSVDRKTGEAVRRFIFSQLKIIGLKEEDLLKCTFVTDGAGNLKVAFRDTGFERVTCAGHLLNTGLQNCFKKNDKANFPMPKEAFPVLDLINQVKALVRHCKKGGISRQLSVTLKQHCETRWNTHVEMLASVLAVYEELETVLAERGESQLLPNSKQKLQDLHDLFEPVRDATLLLSASKVPTIHLVVPAYLELKRHFKNPPPSDFADIRALQRHAEHVFDKKLELDEIHKVAVFLDPSMKHMNFFTPAERVKIIERVMPEVQKIKPLNIGAPTAEAVQPPPKKTARFDVKALAKFSTEQPIQNEVEKYIRQPSPPEGQDVLQYWTEKEKEFPRLSRFAKRILSVPTTSTPSERLFSDTGNTVNEKHTNLLPQTLSDLMVIQWNNESENEK